MSNDERESLRRIAYGPEATPQERAAAERSLRELDARSLAVASDARDAATLETQQRREAVPVDEAAVEHTDTARIDEAARPTLWQRSIRIGWLIPIGAGIRARQR